jgi:hypothetical protein
MILGRKGDAVCGGGDGLGVHEGGWGAKCGPGRQGVVSDSVPEKGHFCIGLCKMVVSM